MKNEKGLLSTTPSHSKPPIFGAAWLLLIASILLLTIGTFALPYFVPVVPSFSQSWGTGFNNRASLACFLLGALIFAFLPSSYPVEGSRSRLPAWTFWLMTMSMLLACLAWGKRGGPESLYFVDRQLHLMHGERIYRDFEFIYGPLLLYPGYWLQKLFHLGVTQAYFINWKLQMVVGTALLWYALAHIDIAARLRSLLVAILFLFQLASLQNGGLNYTPFRSCAALVLVVMTQRIWSRKHSAWLTAVSMVCAMLLGFAISAEQGMGLTFGLCAYTLLLAWRYREAFPAWLAALVLCAAVGVLTLASKLGILDTMRMYAAGGYAFPLLPSPANLLVLGTYLFGLILFARALRRRDMDNVAVPLALCGIPMLSAAFGRCDLGHLMSATPLFVLGAFALAQKPRYFAVWALSMASILAVVFLHRLQLRAHIRANASASPIPGPQREGVAATIPVGPKYFAPLVVPRANEDTPRWNAESGFYFGMPQLSNPAQFALKRDEILRRRSPFLLLPDTPDLLQMAFWDFDTEVASLHSLELSPWVPKRVHTLPSASLITDTIQLMYKPTDQRQDGWRVWALR